MSSIPVEAAKRVAEDFDYDQVVIVARKVGEGEHVTTYGKDSDNCSVAARIGAYLKQRVMGWTEEPIDMVLHCPQCMTQHIDRPVGQFYPGMTADESAAQNKAYGHWDNPPHRSHLCADVPTNGVAAIKTRGRNDS